MSNAFTCSKFVQQQVMNMKHLISNLKTGLILSSLLIVGVKFNAQTAEQARMFFNRSHVAIAKVEKEMYNIGSTTYNAEIKKAIKYQVIALNLYKANNFKDAVGYSYKARTQCIEICTNMSISEGVHYALNDDEKTYCKPATYTNLGFNQSLLNVNQIKQIDDLDILDIVKFHQIDLNIK